MSEMKNQENDILNKTVEEGGSYNLIKKRLLTEGELLQTKIEKLNKQRQEEFGGSKSEIIGKVNVRTDNNCIPIDMASLGEYVIFGYDVFIGMKTEVKVEDVLSLYKLHDKEGNFSVEKAKIADSFLDNEDFKRSFKELFEYYKDAKLVQISKNSNYLLVTFKIGKSVKDIKVYRWLFNNDGTLTYKDDNGDKEVELPPSHNFEWIETNRKQFVTGKHPHISILDKIFVETIGGDLTVKLENNTQEGTGIFSEPVNDSNQSLEDSKVFYAEIGNLKYYLTEKIIIDILYLIA